MFAVFIDQVSPRIHYVLEELLARRLQCELKIHTVPEDFIKDNSPFKIQYVGSEQPDLPGFVVIRSDIMLEDKVNRYFDPLVSSFHLTQTGQKHLEKKWVEAKIPDSEIPRIERFLSKPFPCLFPNDSVLGFDVFAMAFYFLSRYEEYQDFKADSFGRFGFENALESQWNYDPAPHVDIAFFHFLSAIQAEHLSPKADIIASFDIDIAYQFRGRSWQRQLASALRFPSLLFERLRVLFGSKDPFDPSVTVFPFIEDLHVEHRIFWLCSKRVKGVNRQVKRRFTPFVEAIKKATSIGNIGLHPSFSFHPKTAWLEEKLWLEQTALRPIEHSRQHFVHLVFPDTYRILLELGITDDWSMGYAENVGFRAGTACDFKWFDLSSNTATSLNIHPFCIMDVTAKNYMELNPDAAIDAGRTLKEMVFLFGGNFTFIAHNESLSERVGWEGWMPVFRSWASPKIHVSRSMGY